MHFSNKFSFIDINPDDYLFDGRLQTTSHGIAMTDPTDKSWPSIKNTYPQWFSLLSGLTVVSTATPGATGIPEVRVQISNEQNCWYYWGAPTSGADLQWLQADSGVVDIPSVSNTPEELSQAIISKFPFQIDGGNFFWRLFLSGGVVIESLTVSGDSYYTTPGQVRNFLQPFGLRRYEPGDPEYCEQTDFLTDTKIRSFVGAADGYINNITQQDFYYHKDEVEFRDGSGTDVMVLWHYPIRKITKVIMYNPMLQSMRAFVDTELIIDPERGQVFLPPIYPAYLSDYPMRAMFGNTFITGRRNIQFCYDFGFDSPPPDIQQAALKYVGTQMMSAYYLSISKGRNSVSFDGYSESYMSGKPLGGLFDDWKKEIDQILARWIRLYPKAIPGVN
jgi:hypothetical protein